MQMNAIESSSNWDLVVMRPCVCECARHTKAHYFCFTIYMLHSNCVTRLRFSFCMCFCQHVYSILIFEIPTRIRNWINKHEKRQRHRNSYTRNGQNACIKRCMKEYTDWPFLYQITIDSPASRKKHKSNLIFGMFNLHISREKSDSQVGFKGLSTCAGCRKNSWESIRFDSKLLKWKCCSII